jgi:hypothetical protein
MSEINKKIKKAAEERVLSNNDGNKDFSLFIDKKVMKKGETLDIITDQIKFDQPTTVIFVDDEPGKNFGHRCHYLLYNSNTGEFLRKVPAKFPYFLTKTPETLEMFRSSQITERYTRKKKLRNRLDLAKMSAYAKIAPFPLKYWIRGRRYAILYSGASNGRHLNDLEFLYRTLLDVYGFDPADIYVLNHDGTINYNRDVWSNGWTEPPPTDGFGPDGSNWRIVVNEQGNRTGFQNIINELKTRIGPNDCLLIHTNNHGWYDSNGGFMSAYGGKYYATDFADDIAQLPQFKTLLIFMEQCASGSFATPVMNHTPAANTVFQSAVPATESSAGGWPFDPWAEMWISAMAGVRGDGSTLAISPDDDLNTKISAWEAYDYAQAIDNPTMTESSTNLSKNVYLCRCLTTVKHIKEWKIWGEYKTILEPKLIVEQKQAMEPKMAMETKMGDEGLQYRAPIEQMVSAYEELGDRVTRIEKAVSKLTPFIQTEQRPQIKPANTKKRKE